MKDIIVSKFGGSSLADSKQFERVKEIITELGATSMKEMGLVMKTAKEKLGASADGKTINEVAKKLLQ